MSEESNYEALEVPGIGEFRARKGTSTIELAGGLKYWHDKYQTEVVSVRLASFTAGVAMTVMVGIISFAIYWLW